MLERLGYVTLLKSVIDNIKKTGYPCYDSVPLDASPPYYFAEIVGSEPADTKTMFVDTFVINVHCIANSENGSSVEVFNMISGLEEVMTEDIELPSCFNLLSQDREGLVRLTTDSLKSSATNSSVVALYGFKHGVLSYNFKVCYGFKIK